MVRSIISVLLYTVVVHPPRRARDRDEAKKQKKNEQVQRVEKAEEIKKHQEDAEYSKSREE